MNISVIIPCFRSGGYLLEAVQSVLNQRGDFELQEIIVVDDASDDPETHDAYKKVTSERRVKLIKNQEKKGSAGARNTGILHSTGEWIAFLDADDILLDNSISYRVDLIKKYKDMEWCGGDFIQFNGAINYNIVAYFESKLDHYPFLQSSYYSEEKHLVFDKPIEIFLQQAPATTGTIMARRDSIIRAGLFDTDLLMQQDIHLFLRLALKCKFGFIGKPLLAKRQHKNNTTSDLATTLEWRVKAYRKLFSDPEFSKYKEKLNNQIFNIYTDLCYLNRKAKSFNRAFACSVHSIFSKPTSTEGWKNMIASMLRI